MNGSTSESVDPATALETAGTPGRGRKLVVAIPCLNEASTIGRVIEALPREMPGVSCREVVVVDDGSTDRTAEIARAAGARVIRHTGHRGLGQAFRSGVEAALDRGADLVVTIDGDGQFDPADVPLLLAPILAGEADMVTASRFSRPELVPEMPRLKIWGNRAMAALVSRLTGQRFADVSCGFRAFSRDTLLRINLFGSFTYTQETFLDMAFKNLSIREIPLRVRGVREHGRSRMASNLPRYALRTTAILLRAFLSFRPLAFFAAIAAAFLLAGCGLLGFLLHHYVTSGSFSPHIWAGFVGGSLAFVGTLTLVLGLLGDMLVRIRLNQESILYLLRRRAYRRRQRAGDGSMGGEDRGAYGRGAA